MTRAKAADVAQAIINAGIPCTIIPGLDVNSGWRISVRLSITDNLNIVTANTFIANQGVVGTVTGIDLS